MQNKSKTIEINNPRRENLCPPKRSKTVLADASVGDYSIPSMREGKIVSYHTSRAGLGPRSCMEGFFLDGHMRKPYFHQEGEMSNFAYDEEDSSGLIVWVFIAVFIFIVMSFVIFMFYVKDVHAYEIDMGRIAMIESSGNPLAHNKRDDSRGLYQITPICLKEWNNFHPKEQYTMNDLWNPRINERIAGWYINHRIPQMLSHYKVPDTTENRIICFNVGIKRAIAHNREGAELPLITKNYIKKYRGMK